MKLTKRTHPDNPFLTHQLPDGHWTGHTDAASRIHAVGHFDLLQCEQALGVLPLQRQMIKAIEKRMRQLEKTV